jgi:hypothetical protein
MRLLVLGSVGVAVLLIAGVGFSRVHGHFVDELVMGASMDSEVEQRRMQRRTEVIERMAHGIWKFKTEGGRVPWWHCGESIDVEASREEAKRWAAGIVGAAVAGDNGLLNPWGMAGVITRESSFDECAVDFVTRRWAYRNKILKPPPTHITHSMEEIYAMVNDKRFKQKRGGKLDAGPGQLRWGSITKLPLEQVMTLDPGLMVVADEMRSRSVPLVKDARFSRILAVRPWRMWPGHYDDVYGEKIEGLARMLGARRSEI